MNLGVLRADQFEAQGRSVWEKLYSMQNTSSPFLHSDIIAAWLRSSSWGRTATQYIIADSNNCPLASWFISKKPSRWSRIMGDAAWLNADGGPGGDRLFVEYNYILSDPDKCGEVQRIFGSLLRQSNTRSLSVSGATECFALNLEREFSDWQFDRQVWPCRYVVLSEVRKSAGGYLGLIGANTRYSIRRTARRITELGEVKVEIAASPCQAQKWFSEMVTLHEQRWKSRGEAGAFSSDERRNMHTLLLESAGADKLVHFVRVSAGATLIGILYCFVVGGHVYFYQSGINYEAITNGHPGLLLHAAVIEFYASQGYKEYDFLASPEGVDSYKQQLATHCRNLYWLTVTRSLWSLLFRGQPPESSANIQLGNSLTQRNSPSSL